MTCLPESEIAYHPLSFLDKGGRLFSWRGELYRGINAVGESRVDQLFRSGLIQRLIERGLFVQTEVAPFCTEKYALVLRHQIIPFVAYPDEWSPPMFKDAVLALLDFLIELARAGHTSNDPHLWNIVFDGCRPFYVDLSSIVPADTSAPWPFFREFCKDCLNPLLLMKQGREHIARILIHEGVPDSELGGGPESGTEPMTAKLLRRVSAFSRKAQGDEKSDEAFFQDLRSRVEAIPLPRVSDVSPASMAPPDHDGETSRQAVQRCLGELKPAAILDVSGDSAAALAAATSGIRVVAFRSADSAAAQLYETARAQRLPLLPLTIDITQPTTERGLFGHRGQAAMDRFVCDGVLALDLLPRLVFDYRRLSLEQIAAGLAMFSKRWLVIEYVAPLPAQHERWASRFPWYTLENLITALGGPFQTVTKLHEQGVERVIFLCQK